MSELKPCPFCGEMPETDGRLVQCYLMPCSARNFKMPIDSWNTRPIEDALNARIAELEAVHRWIPVGDRPLVDGRFIVLLKNGDIRRDFTFLDGGRYYWWYSGDQVTHYMPLPEPPKEREE